MSQTRKHLQRGVCLALLAGMLHGVALADPPEWAGGHKRERHKQEDRDDDHDRRGYDRGEYRVGAPGARIDIRIGGYFGDAQRRYVYEHYDSQYRGGFCPPGLAKKNNGCMPPGQARAWALGQPLPTGVVYYPVEPGISVRLGLPPEGYKYVRVASDILLVAVGSNMVIDAIKDLGR